MTSLTRLALFPILAVSSLACSEGRENDEPPGAMALYDTSPERPDFFSLPWPSDARLVGERDGRKHVDLTGFYNPGYVIGSYIDAIQNGALGGFGTQSAIYFRFDAPLDPASLPAGAAASIDAHASVFLVDVSPESPSYGQRHPLRAHFVTQAGKYIEANWLALRPEPGFPLREGTTYTAVVSDAVRALDGGRVHRDPRFTDAGLSLDEAVLGLEPGHVAAATTFTTQTATLEMQELRDAVYRQPAPVVADLTHHAGVAGVYDEYRGTYPSPNFQEGDPPYMSSGGAIHQGADHHPEPVRVETLRFSTTIPQATMPAAGWPVVIYAHGTGGDYRSYIDDGSARQAALVRGRDGEELGRMAMISIDQVLHGPRDPTKANPEITFFNVQNCYAGRDNPKQGALDDFQLVRLIESINIESAPTTGAPIRFDPERIYFKGHSQGGLTGPLFLAFEPKIKAAVLSGAGGGLILSLLEKTQPVNIRALAEMLVGEPIDEVHPLLNMMQLFLEGSDPANYGRYFLREPPAGLPAKSIYQSLGVVDHYTPIPNIKVLALTMGVQPVRPEIEPFEDLGLTQLEWTDAPVTGNVAGGTATGVVCEYEVPLKPNGEPSYDGHFVVFDHPDAKVQANAFLVLHASTGAATLVP